MKGLGEYLAKHNQEFKGTSIWNKVIFHSLSFVQVNRDFFPFYYFMFNLSMPVIFKVKKEKKIHTTF